MVQVSICHIIFKVVTAFVLLPFTKAIVRLSYRFVPKKAHESERRLLYIDTNLATAPSTTLLQVQKEVERMGRLARNNFVMAAEGLIENDLSKAQLVKAAGRADQLSQSCDYRLFSQVQRYGTAGRGVRIRRQNFSRH